MSIYSELVGSLDGEKLEAERPAGSRRASVVLAENLGGDPLMGISYRCDFRSEEETGAGEMAQMFTRLADPESFFAKEYLLGEPDRYGNAPSLIEGTTQAQLVTEGDGLVIFTTGLSPSSSQLQDAKRFLKDTRPGADERSEIKYRYWNLSALELKAEAKRRGIKGYSKLTKDAALQLIIEDQYSKDHPEGEPESYSQPGWFHYGDALIFEAQEGLFGQILQKLVEAAKAGQLVVGSGGIGAFGNGFSLFDGRDLTEEHRAQISEHNAWYRAQREALKPVAAVVAEGPMRDSYGTAWYSLGRLIQQNEHGEAVYWLNGASVKMPNGRSVQPSGYYTLQELLDEKYMEDARAQSDEDFKRYTPEGNFRGQVLTEEQMDQELQQRKLSRAVQRKGA